MTRRRLLASGTALLAGVGAAFYGPLLVGDEFEEWVASALGVDSDTATELLAQARLELGEGDYEARAAAFAIAFRSPLSGLVPGSLRRSAASALVGPMFTTSAAGLSYAGRRIPRGSRCAGLIRPS